uniref:EF-hand domain-containing protein n=1 Tax=Kalanchoe fedtschenkoi TaxID=63787 RepID=A0A7N0U3I1_KALFE
MSVVISSAFLESPPHRIFFSNPHHYKNPNTIILTSTDLSNADISLQTAEFIFRHKKKKMACREFEDLLPVMASRLGGEGLIRELCNGFKLLMDKDKGVITMESLKRNAAVLGLGGMGDDELRSMLREGDVDGDGALSEMEFCVLMFRLSPGKKK